MGENTSNLYNFTKCDFIVRKVPLMHMVIEMQAVSVVSLQSH